MSVLTIIINNGICVHCLYEQNGDHVRINDNYTVIYCLAINTLAREYAWETTNY